MVKSVNESPILRCDISDIVALIEGSKSAADLGLEVGFTLGTWQALKTQIPKAKRAAGLALSEADAFAHALLGLGFHLPVLPPYIDYITVLKKKMDRQLTKYRKKQLSLDADLSEKLAYTPAPKQEDEAVKENTAPSIEVNASTGVSSQTARAGDDHRARAQQQDRNIRMLESQLFDRCIKERQALDAMVRLQDKQKIELAEIQAQLAREQQRVESQKRDNEEINKAVGHLHQKFEDPKEEFAHYHDSE
mmetsp:Transcript_18331/g.40064  ORF Transcript_18331/g.40064 Transcript_18331/m.40064 type:complete len:249 (-) Transcript_18331:848-1594(-)